MSNELLLKIQKGIPIPTTKARQGNNIELLRQMQPGDSVFFDAPIVKRATRFYRVAKNVGAKVIIRKENEGMRMWLQEWITKPSSDSPAVAKAPAAKPKSPAKAAKPAPAKKAAKPVKKTAPPKTTKKPTRKPARKHPGSPKVERASMADLAGAVAPASVVEGAGAA